MSFQMWSFLLLVPYANSSQVLLPVVTMLNALLNCDLKGCCSSFQLSGSSCFLMNFSAWYPVTWKFDSFSTFDCISCRVQAIFRYMLLKDTLSMYPRCIISVPLVFLNMFVLPCVPSVAVDSFHWKVKIVIWPNLQCCPTRGKISSWSLLLISLCPEAW